MQALQARPRKRTIRLYRLTDDGRRLLAGTIAAAAASPAELVGHWRAFLATAARGVYIAHYRGETLGVEAAAEAAHAALAA
jgi:hypothetical protein